MSLIKLTLLITLTLSLSSCFMKSETPDAGSGSMTETPTVSRADCTEIAPMDSAARAIWEAGNLPDASDDMVGSGDIAYVNYTLRTCTADGEILDTSREADAILGGMYMTGRAYEPFSTVIGSHTTVRGFEYGLIGMKKGERKTIAVAPIDGYAGPRVEKVPLYAIAPTYTQTLDKSLFEDIVVETISREQLGEMGKDVKVGQTLTGGQDGAMTAKITKVTDNEVTVEIDNSGNPFHGKILAPGLSVEVESGTTFTVKSLAGTGITFDIENKNSPFYGAFTVGTSVDLPVGKVTIDEIGEDAITVSIEEQADPTDKKKWPLFFDVEIVDIK